MKGDSPESHPLRKEGTPGKLEIVWSPRALRRLKEIRDYPPEAYLPGLSLPPKPKEGLDGAPARLVSVVAALQFQPYMGRATAEPGIRELVIGGTPYIVMYKPGNKRVSILTIWHGKQLRD